MRTQTITMTLAEAIERAEKELLVARRRAAAKDAASWRQCDVALAESHLANLRKVGTTMTAGTITL